MTTPTPEQLKSHLKVARSYLTELQDSLNKINAQIDAEDIDSEDLHGMRQARAQILYDIELNAEEIADYVEQLGDLPSSS